MRNLRRVIAVLLCVFALNMFPLSAHALQKEAALSIIKIAVGHSTGLFLLSDGSVWEFGYPYEKRVYGENRQKMQYIPQKKMTDVQDIAVGGVHYLAVKTDGTLWAWGEHDHGALGNGRAEDEVITAEPIKVMKGVEKCYAYNGSSMAIKKDGSLYIWGAYFDHKSEYGFKNILKPKKIMDNALEASIGNEHFLVKKEDGSIWGWGSNGIGMLGIADLWYTYKPLKIMDGDVSGIAAGFGYSMILKEDGSLWATGSDAYYELGVDLKDEGNYSNKLIKVMDNVRHISVSEDNVAAIKKDGSLWTWGSNIVDQLGIGRQFYPKGPGLSGEGWWSYDDNETIQYFKRNLPNRILNDVSMATFGSMGGVAVKEDGSIWIWGNWMSKNGEYTRYLKPVRLEWDYR